MLLPDYWNVDRAHPVVQIANVDDIDNIDVDHLFIMCDCLPVLDSGFVRCVSVMGDDSSIVQAARVSYGAGTKTVRDDTRLINYLMSHRHTTPFEMVEYKFHVRVPMDCWRQWIRHRTASVNEYSTRYSVAIDACYKTQPGKWRKQSTRNKQGSSNAKVPLCDADQLLLTKEEEELCRHAREVYEKRLSLGVARELARKDLPLSTYTEAYWKIDLHNLLHFLRLRLASEAQYEIRQYARALACFVERFNPICYGAFKNGTQ